MKTQILSHSKTGEFPKTRSNSGWTLPKVNLSDTNGLTWTISLREKFKSHVIAFEEDRFAAMTILITFQSCLGSVGAYYALVNDAFVGLYVAAAVTMAANSAFIAQAPAKWCVAIFYTSVIANGLVILMNLF